MTPQVRSRDSLEKRGWTVATVEQLKWFPDNKKQPCLHCRVRPMIMVRVDLFGFGDILAFNGMNTLIVQATDYTSMSKRWRKIQESKEARNWLSVDAARSIVVHGWRKVGNRWQVKERMFAPEDFEVTRMSEWETEGDLLPF